MRAKRRVLAIPVVICLQLALGMVAMRVAHANADPVTITKHADLGFTTGIPVDVDTGVASPPCLLTVVVCLFHGAIAFHGTMNVGVKLGTDVALTYDPSQLHKPNGPLPVMVKYTPTPGESTVTYAQTVNMTFAYVVCTDCATE